MPTDTAQFANHMGTAAAQRSQWVPGESTALVRAMVRRCGRTAAKCASPVVASPAVVVRSCRFDGRGPALPSALAQGAASASVGEKRAARIAG